ncbi:HK97 family phage prohead protease [Methylocystis hirsuta]|uniref:HK97 family phage prohead protease n=1 Tax=Methylocystis hirsuta TaxID=369798 RepID=A0A3M9XTI7_9HYPH|nr:HK97 family phage prohead protease [Methylocystis hirsuta]RNJ51175.1 HK97 family phage prohead protease [Methylocystis hirsuta]
MAALQETTSSAGAPEIKRAESPLLQANEAGAFSGYASLFDVVDSGGDMVMTGAFARSLTKRGAQGVKMLWQHQAAEPIGMWSSIVEDSRGLKVEGRLDLSVARAREALSLMRKGAIDGLSIGFRTLRATTEKSTGVRRLHDIDLWEISIVTFPMLAQARIGAVKHSRNAAPSIEALGAKLSRLRAQRAALDFAQALRRLSETT